MYSSAKAFVSRRAPARFAGLSKSKENETEEEKKEREERYENSAPGKALNWYMQNIAGPVEDYWQSRIDNFNEIKENGDGNLLLGIINTTAKDLGKVVSSAEQGFDSSIAGDVSGQGGSVAKPIVYSDWSPASKLFGMDQGTAFGEHMANTAHQREVADLRAAGLNPVLGISGSGSSSVSGNAAVGSSSAEKVQEFPWMDVLGATAGLVTTLVSKKPALGYMVSNVFKAFD